MSIPEVFFSPNLSWTQAPALKREGRREAKAWGQRGFYIIIKIYRDIFFTAPGKGTGMRWISRLCPIESQQPPTQLSQFVSNPFFLNFLFISIQAMLFIAKAQVQS